MQSQSGKSEVMLVAIEYGGRWQANLAPRPAMDVSMVVQLPGEDPLAEGLTENAPTDCDRRVGNETITCASAAVERMGGRS